MKGFVAPHNVATTTNHPAEAMLSITNYAGTNKCITDNLLIQNSISLIIPNIYQLFIYTNNKFSFVDS